MRLEKLRKLEDLQSLCPQKYKSREQGGLRRLFISADYKLDREHSRDAAFVWSLMVGSASW